jgi:hypothetical protein
MAADESAAAAYHNTVSLIQHDLKGISKLSLGKRLSCAISIPTNSDRSTTGCDDWRLRFVIVCGPIVVLIVSFLK